MVQNSIKIGMHDCVIEYIHDHDNCTLTKIEHTDEDGIEPITTAHRLGYEVNEFIFLMFHELKEAQRSNFHAKTK